ncbi:HNH endonuclease signature motif containing protein [Novosphingobium sp. B1]|uniref:HNH endonuclease signature motif containing protein n=1 Tax=Novosphingobium sp. B1 TaxID=1938756 RepID=UPI001592B426|nr:HNH endonuclease signature motif containing protein [Novosphingobium sp. B1]
MDKRPSSCWEWRGKVSHNGYGQFEHKGRSWRAHRYAYTLAKGDIPPGMMVLHSCDNRRCCNPDHLRIGTAKDNWRDAFERNRLTPAQINKFSPRKAS